jgi:hypothetical protein
MYHDEDDDEDYEPHCLKDKRVVKSKCSHDDVLLQFNSIEDAVRFRDEFNDIYWKNNTLHVEFRPDCDMKTLLGEERPVKESVKLFMTNAGDVCADEICQASLPVIVNDVQVHAGQPFAFVFLQLQTQLASSQTLPLQWS